MILLKFTLQAKDGKYVAVADAPIRDKEIVEGVPVLKVTYPATIPYVRWLRWEALGEFVVPLGYSSCFAESGEPNLVIERNIAAKAVTFRALRSIAKGEVLTVDWSRER